MQKKELLRVVWGVDVKVLKEWGTGFQILRIRTAEWVAAIF